MCSLRMLPCLGGLSLSLVLCRCLLFVFLPLSSCVRCFYLLCLVLSCVISTCPPPHPTCVVVLSSCLLVSYSHLVFVYFYSCFRVFLFPCTLVFMSSCFRVISYSFFPCLLAFLSSCLIVFFSACCLLLWLSSSFYSLTPTVTIRSICFTNNKANSKKSWPHSLR
jgi:hypothetical protein